LEQFLADRGIAVPQDEQPPPPPIVLRATAARLAAEAMALQGAAVPIAGPPAPPTALLPAELPTTAPSSAAERFVGTKVAAVVGSIAVLGGLGFFIKLAIDMGLLGRMGPVGKFAGGLTVAALLLTAAEVARRRWSREASVGLNAAGVASLFVTIAGGVFVLDLFSATTGAVLALMATIAGGAIAARSQSLIVATLGLLGGFVLPLSVGVLQMPGITGAVLLTAVLMVALVMEAMGPRQFAALRVISLALLAPAAAVWGSESGVDGTTLTGFIVLWWALFLAAAIAASRKHGPSRTDGATLVVASALACLTPLMVLTATTEKEAFTHPLDYVPTVVLLALLMLGARLRTLMSKDQVPLLSRWGPLMRGAEAFAPFALAAAGAALVQEGALSLPGFAGGAFLSAYLVLALVVVYVGPAFYAWIRVVAPFILLHMSEYWSAETHVSGGVLAMLAVVWWGAMIASALVEALRGRSPRLNAATVVLTSALVSVVALISLGSNNAFTEPLSYVPFGVAAGLGVLILQFRVGAQDDTEHTDAEAARILEALRTLVNSAIAIIPATALVALGVFLPAGALCVGAAGCACILLLARERLGAWTTIPLAMVSILVAVATAAYTTVIAVNRPAVPIPGLDALVGQNSALRMLIEVRLSTDLLGPLLCAVLLLIPLARAKTRFAAVHISASFGVLLLITMLTASLGPWPAAMAGSLMMLTAVGFGMRRLRWLPHSIAFMAWALLAWAIGPAVQEIWWRGHAPALVYWVATLVVVCAGQWSLRRLAPPTKRSLMDAVTALTLVIGTAVATLLEQGTNGSVDQPPLPLLLLILSAGSIFIGLLARGFPSLAMTTASLLPVLPALAIVATLSVTTMFGTPIPQELRGHGVWALAFAAPFGAFALALWLGRTALKESRYWPKDNSGVGEATLISALCSLVVCSATVLDGTPPAELVIAAMAVCGAGSIVWGFRRKLAGFRWTGLVLLGVLALRLFVVDMRDTSTVFRVSVLFVTGLVLVGTSIAYTLLMAPKKSS
jgi:hypothetical protein